MANRHWHLELRPHMEELVESSAKREIPGNFCYVANLSLTQFPLHPVHENYDLFFKFKGNYLSLPDFPGNLSCFRPCWEAPGSCSPKHHALTPHASLACVQSRVPAWEDFSWTRGPEKEDSFSTTCQGS